MGKASVCCATSCQAARGEARKARVGLRVGLRVGGEGCRSGDDDWTPIIEEEEDARGANNNNNAPKSKARTEVVRGIGIYIGAECKSRFLLIKILKLSLVTRGLIDRPYIEIGLKVVAYRSNLVEVHPLGHLLPQGVVHCSNRRHTLHMQHTRAHRQRHTRTFKAYHGSAESTCGAYLGRHLVEHDLVWTLVSTRFHGLAIHQLLDPFKMNVPYPMVFDMPEVVLLAGIKQMPLHTHSQP